MPKKVPRKVKLENRAARKVAKTKRKANAPEVKTFLDEKQKVIIREACEEMSGDVNNRPVVIDHVCEFPDVDNVSSKVKTYMKRNHVKEHVYHKVFELFKGFENAKVTHKSHVSYIPEKVTAWIYL